MTHTHRFDPTILREYDVRGIVGETITPDDAWALGRAFGTVIARRGGGRAFTGYDGRASSPALEEAVTRAGDAFGLTVDLDVIDPSQAPFVSTPVADGLDLDTLLDALRAMPHRDRLCGLEVAEIADVGDMAVARDMVAAIIAASV